jgi:O-antigen/teichoic acid export membrane protein
MGYVEDVLGDKEQILYRTHQHVIVLVERLGTLLFAAAVFLALGLAILFAPQDESGDRIRFVVGLIALGSLILPVYVIISAWRRDLRGEELRSRIWRPALAGVLILVAALLLLLNSEFRPIGWVAVILAIAPFIEAGCFTPKPVPVGNVQC